MLSKFISFESRLFTLKFLFRKEQININFEINFQCERGLRKVLGISLFETQY